MTLEIKRMVIFSTVILLAAGTSVAFAAAGSSFSTVNSDKSVSTIKTASNGDRTRIEKETDGTVTTIYPDKKIVIRSNDSSVSTYSAPDKSGAITYDLQRAEGENQSYSQDPGSYYVPSAIVKDVFQFPGLNSFLDKPASFTVQKDLGNVAVCGMTYSGVTLTNAPWKFTLNPTKPAGDPLQIHYCYGANESISLHSQVAFGIDRTFFNGDTNSWASASDYHPSKAREIVITNNSAEFVTATLTDSAGKVVATKNYAGVTDQPTKDEFFFTLEEAKTPLDKYTLSLTSKSYLMTWPIVSTSLWASLDYKELNPFAPCSTLTWIYLPQADPSAGTVSAPTTASNANVMADIKGALAMLSARTSLKFVFSADNSLNGKPNVISYDWKHLSGISGQGGPVYFTKGAFPADSDYSGNWGSVDVNPESSWGANDLFKGAGNLKSPEIAKANKLLHAENVGRQWLLAHETMHVLGFDHSVDPKSIMFYHGGLNTFTAADEFALNYFYPACKV
jgi:hypothetical protein